MVVVAAEDPVGEAEVDEEDLTATQTKSPFFKPLQPFEIELLMLDDPCSKVRNHELTDSSCRIDLE